MSRIKTKITEVLRLQPQKPCRALDDRELVDEEAHCRHEIIRLVLSLTLHVGSCTTHAVLSAGVTLPLHLPVVVWIAYSLTRTARRHRALKAEARTNRPGVQFKQLQTKRIAPALVLAIISPILGALGADIINEIVFTLAGSDNIVNIGSSDSVKFGGDANASGYSIVTAGDGSSHQLSLTQSLTGTAIEELLEMWQDRLVNGVSDDFKELVAEIDPTNRGGVTLPSHYQVYCNACYTQINDGFSCTECHDFDLCRECYVEVKHQDVKRHAYTEFRVEEEISQIQRIIGSLRRENVVVESGRGGHTRCDVCHSLLSAPTSTSNEKELAFYYKCKNCPDFDICSKCFPDEAPKEIHTDHKFSMIVATDDEATISRLSPNSSKHTLGSRRLSPTQSPPERHAYVPGGGLVSSPQSLFSPMPRSRSGSGIFASNPELSSPPPAYAASAFDPGCIWPKGDIYWCDGCRAPIQSDRRLSCNDPICLSSGGMDFHVECGGWTNGYHRSTHQMRTLFKV